MQSRYTSLINNTKEPREITNHQEFLKELAQKALQRVLNPSCLHSLLYCGKQGRSPDFPLAYLLGKHAPQNVRGVETPNLLTNE